MSSPQAVLDDLEHALSGRGDLSVTREGRCLMIEPLRAAGFPITLRMVDDGYHVDFGGCEQEFDDIHGACDWVLRAVSPDYRLRTEMRGGVASRWSLERRDGAVALTCGHTRWTAWLWRSEETVVLRSYAGIVRAEAVQARVAQAGDAPLAA